MPYTPPLHSLQAEEALIASLLIDDTQAWGEGVTGIVQPEDFTDPRCRALYRCALRLKEKGLPVSLPSLMHAMDQLGFMEAYRRVCEEGGITPEGYILDIEGKWYTAIGASAHAGVVADYASRRRKVAVSAALVREAYDSRHRGEGGY